MRIHFTLFAAGMVMLLQNPLQAQWGPGSIHGDEVQIDHTTSGADLNIDTAPTLGGSCTISGTDITPLDAGDAIINEFILHNDEGDALNNILWAFKAEVDKNLAISNPASQGVNLTYIDLKENGVDAVAQAWKPVSEPTYQKTTDVVHDVLVTIPMDAAIALEDNGQLCNIYGHTFGLFTTVKGDGNTWPNYVIGTEEQIRRDICDTDCVTGLPKYGPSLTQYDPMQNCETDGNMIAGLMGNSNASITTVHAAIFDTPVHLDGFAAFNGLQVERYGDDTSDPSGHGSAVAALMVQDFVKHGDLNKVVLHSWPVLDENGKGDLATLLLALNEALEQDEISLWNMSLGFNPEDDCASSEVSAITAAMQTAADREIFVLTSAGNSGNNIDIEPQIPAAEDLSSYKFTVGSFECGSRIPEPTNNGSGKPYYEEQTQNAIDDFPEAVTAAYSNRSYNLVDMLGPGENIFVPNVVTDCYFTVSGTSFSTPLISSILLRGLTTMEPSLVLCEFNDQRLAPLGPSSDATLQLLATNQVGSLLTIGCFRELEDVVIGDLGGGPTGGGKFQFGKNKSLGQVGKTSLFPNPNNGFVNLRLAGETKGKASATVYNSVGHAVKRQAFTGSALSIDLTLQAPGVYTVRIERNETMESLRFIKQ